MSLKSSLEGIGSSILGNPKKAVLILHKGSTRKVSTADVIKQTEMSLAQPGAAGGLKALSGALGASFHVLQVQYNPSSIRINANSEDVVMQYLQKNVDEAIPNQNVSPPSVVMSVDLIFDAVNLKDSFMFEKLRLSVGDVVSAISSLLKGGYTVQPQTNGLIGALMRDSTRVVTFKWADMAFTGELNEVSARYTMFSVSGKPVRSVVTLNIVQTISSNGDYKYWNDAFDKCFGDALSAATVGGKGKLAAAQNLVNVTF